MLPVLLGNPAIHQQMKGALTHAYIIAGQTGSGRSIVTAHLAMKALCESPTSEPCQSCKSCRKFLHQSHPDYHTFGKTNPLSVEEVRDLQKLTPILPNDSQRAVYVIYQGERMLHGAQNALLKLLEEPPSHVLFLIITEESGNVLETIRSRCISLTLRPLARELIEQAIFSRGLAHYGSYPIQSAMDKSNGYLGQALDALIPERRVKEELPSEEHSQFHQALQGTGVGKKIPKKKAVKKENIKDIKEQELENLAEKLAYLMIKKEELELFRTVYQIEKYSKEQLRDLFTLLQEKLTKTLLKEKKPEMLKYLKFIEEILDAVEGNVKGGQLIGWLTAGTMTKAEPHHQ